MRDPDLILRREDGKDVRRAWKLNPELFPAQAAAQAAATCESWLVTGNFHPVWTYWVVSVVHLRELPGQPPAVLRFPEATHEFMIVSLESPPMEGCPAPDPDNLDTFHILMPIDMAHQVAGLTDAQAAEICGLMVKHIVIRGASPDSDFRRFWEGTLEVTAEHYREGICGSLAVHTEREN